MKTLIVLAALLSTSACAVLAPATVAGIGIVTGVALTTNEPKVEEFGDKYLSNGE